MAIREHQAFLAAFDALHREMRLVFGLDGADFDSCARFARERRRMRSDDLAFLDQCRHIRNFLAHTNDVIATGMVGIAIDRRAVERLERIRDLLADRLLATRFAVPIARVQTARMTDLVEPLMRQMSRSDFSHLPVIENHVVHGVFDERVLFRALSDDRLDGVTSQTRVADIVDSFTFDRVDPSDFGVIFAPRKVSVAELRRELERRIADLDRISLILITENGKASERLLALLTIWDIPFGS